MLRAFHIDLDWLVEDNQTSGFYDADTHETRRRELDIQRPILSPEESSGTCFYEKQKQGRDLVGEVFPYASDSESVSQRPEQYCNCSILGLEVR